MQKVSRNYGIDILRIASIVGVVFLHVLGHGGILNSELSSTGYAVAWLFEILAYPAVNCFVLVSGYVGYRGETVFPKIKNLVSLLLTVVFYSVSLCLVFMLVGCEPFGLGSIAKSFFPTIFNGYWFFTAYFGMFLLSPLLNLLVFKSNSKHSFVFLVVFSMFSIISTVCDTFSLLNGYHLLWFVFMYLIGAIIKKYNLNNLFSKKVWFCVTLFAFIITWLSKILLHFSDIPFLDNHSGTLVKYVSPTIVLMAIGLLNWFSKINCPRSLAPVITFFASSAFSVYLIHDNYYVRTYIISKIHTLIGNYHFVWLTLSIIGSVAAIFLTCTFIDKIRILLFKIIKIDKLTENIEKWTKSIINMTYARVKKALQTVK